MRDSLGSSRIVMLPRAKDGFDTRLKSSRFTIIEWPVLLFLGMSPSSLSSSKNDTAAIETVCAGAKKIEEVSLSKISKVVSLVWIMIGPQMWSSITHEDAGVPNTPRMWNVTTRKWTNDAKELFR